MAFLVGTDPGLRKTKPPTVNTFVAGVGFTAGSSTTIALTDSPGTEEHLTIFFDGVGQHRSTYSVSGSTVTFDTAIPTGVAEIEATYAPAVYAQLSTVSDNEITLAKMAGGTDGNIISYDASGNPVAIATGNDGQILTSAGAGAQPAFEDAAGGGAWTLIGTQVASSSSSLTQTGITSTYDTYALALSDMRFTGDGDPLQFRFGTSSGINSSTDYVYHAAGCATSGNSYVGGRWDGAAMKMSVSGIGNATGEGLGGLAYLHFPTDGVGWPMMSGTYIASKNDGVPEGGFMIGALKDVIDVDRIYVWADAGITSGRMTLWGISHA